MSFQRLLRSLRTQFSPQETEPHSPEQAIRLATAGILLELAYADSSFSIAEEEKIVDFLQSHFDLNEDEVRELIEAADELRTHAIDHFDFTNRIRQNTGFEDRKAIVRTMWRMVYADGAMHQYEGYLVRKLSELLGIEHRVMIEQKLAVHEELKKRG
jgi:uncharacterized tellurite resistance protein B-like protein